MADITVRKMRFDFETQAPFTPAECDREFSAQCSLLGISLTLPYLEPYLIRTMKKAIPAISNEALAEDARNFSRQEGHHYAAHAKFNAELHRHFGDSVSTQLAQIEKALEADYQRFSRDKSLRFNLGYAEGFEAMTCALALTAADHGIYERPEMTPGGEIWAWHMAEEVEHRTVAFAVYDDIVGSYVYRLAVGTWAQWHYIRYIARFAKCIAASLGREYGRGEPEMERSFRRRYLRSWHPRYDPADMDVPPVIDELLGRFDALATG